MEYSSDKKNRFKTFDQKKNKKIDLKVFTHSCQHNCTNCTSGCWKKTIWEGKLQEKF